MKALPALPPLYLITQNELTPPYQKSFQTSPYFQKNSVVFLSPRIQDSNAVAMVYPVPSVFIYPSMGAFFMDQWSIFHWPQDTLIHEMTHIYQLSQNSKWDRAFRLILGPLSHRNFILPSFMLEGSAVLNESLYGFGGRLFSGWTRAFVFSQLKQGFALKRLLKTYDEPFSDTEKYLHGAYFFAYLHSQYRLKKINSFFSESGRFFPLDFYGLSRSLKRTFGKNLETLFEEYKEHYAPLAEKQKSSPEKTLWTSQISLPMNSDENKIYFLVSDMKSPPRLLIFDKKTGQIKKQKKNLPLGKVFYKEGEFLSSSRGQTSNTSVEFSLFKEDFKPIKKYNSQYVMDMYKNKTISLDTRQSLTQNSLLLNNVFYDNIHSSAVMDHKGRIYYFKQNKDIRTLYRDTKPLVSFKLYYSYPVEADEEGLYFIGATKYGSSLFVYKEGLGLFRLSESDTITDARKIDEEKFLVSEISPTHHKYKIIQTQKIPAKPFLYTYSFKKKYLFEKTGNLSAHSAQGEQNSWAADKNNNIGAFKDKEIVSQNKNLKKTSSSFEPELYNPLSHLSLQQVFLLYIPKVFLPYIPKVFLLYIPKTLLPYINPGFLYAFQFSDPLQFNKLFLIGSLGKKQKRFQLSYSYEEFRPSVAFSFSYEENQLDQSRFKTFKDIDFLETEDIYIPYENNLLKIKDYIPYRDRSFGLSSQYPLLIRSYWNLTIASSLQLGQKQFNNTTKNKSLPFLFYKAKAWNSYINHQGAIRYKYKRKYPYAYSSHSQRGFQLSYNILNTENRSQTYSTTQLSGQIQAYATEEIAKEFFMTVNGVLKRNLWNRETQRSLLKKENEVILSYGSLKHSFQNLNKLDFQLLKVFNHSYYPLKIPFAIRRWGPLAGLSFLSAKETYKKYNYFLIPFIGVESELNLLAEKIIFKVGLSGEYFVDFSKPSAQSSFQLNIWLKGAF